MNKHTPHMMQLPINRKLKIAVIMSTVTKLDGRSRSQREKDRPTNSTLKSCHIK